MTSNGATGATGKATGYWKEEFAAPYYAFIDAGVEVTIASPAGARACVRRAGSERVGVRACVRLFCTRESGLTRVTSIFCICICIRRVL
jgi:putative intracellular protease/amidase